MTDFVDDLERELLAAARRRAGTRRPRLGRVRLPGVRVLVTAMALAAVVVAVGLRADAERDERAVATPPPAVEIDARPPVVLVVNQTTQQGLASAVAETLKSTLGVKTLVDAAPPVRETTEVFAANAASLPLARRVGAALHVPVSAKAPPEPVVPSPRDPAVVVLIGTDRMR